MQEVDLPAHLGAARVEPLDARQHRRGEAGLRRLDRRHVDPDAAHAELVHFGKRGVGLVLVDVDDAAAAAGTDLAHGIEHAGIVAAIGARLNEHEALHAEQPGKLQIVGERRKRRRIAQLLVDAAVRIAVGRTEHMEVRVACIRRRPERGRWFVVGIQRRCPRLTRYWIVTLAVLITSRQTAISRSRWRVISSGVEVTATAACFWNASAAAAARRP